MKKTFADNVIHFNKKLHFTDKLPKGFGVLNPYIENEETMHTMQQFYHKFYADNKVRKFIIGINPSRHGAGVTGVPFTDTKRLESDCGIEMKSAYTHEVSSVFMYDMIKEYGGAEKFYKDIYINSPFPLAIVRKNSSGHWLNANYYDTPELYFAVKKFMHYTLKQHFNFGLQDSLVYVLGKKNAKFIAEINSELKLFKRIEVLEHPRYIQQYKSKEKQLYIDKYLIALSKND